MIALRMLQVIIIIAPISYVYSFSFQQKMTVPPKQQIGQVIYTKAVSLFDRKSY